MASLENKGKDGGMLGAESAKGGGGTEGVKGEVAGSVVEVGEACLEYVFPSVLVGRKTRGF